MAEKAGRMSEGRWALAFGLGLALLVQIAGLLVGVSFSVVFWRSLLVGGAATASARLVAAVVARLSRGESRPAADDGSAPPTPQM